MSTILLMVLLVGVIDVDHTSAQQSSAADLGKLVVHQQIISSLHASVYVVGWFVVL